jgi:hypothetical protein
MGKSFHQDFPKDYDDCTLYNMKRYTAAAARQQFSHILDAAERGEAVVIERRGIRFLVRTEGRSASKRGPAPAPLIEFIDPAVASGQWTWDWDAGGLRFVATKRGRR